MWRCDNCETKNDAGDYYCKVCGNAQNPKTVGPIDTQARKECSPESIMEQLGEKPGSNTIFENKTTITERPIKKGCALLIVCGLAGLCMCCLEAWLSVQNDGFLNYVHEIMILVMMIVSIAGFTYALFMVQTTFLYDDHLESRIKMANMKMKVKYYQINLVLETKGLYLLWGEFHGFTVISKNGFMKGTAAEFERFICKNAINAKMKLLQQTLFDGIGYDESIVIETFGAVPEQIARAASIWRPLVESADALAKDGFSYFNSLFHKAQIANQIDRPPFYCPEKCNEAEF